MSRLLLLLVIIICLNWNCKNKQTLKDKQEKIEAGNLSGEHIYTTKLVGWTVQLAMDWNIMTSEQAEKLNKEGKEIIQKTTGNDVKISDMQQLMSMKKDASNSFISNLQPFDGSNGISYEQTMRNTYDAIKLSYKENNINAEYSEEAEIIDGLRFYKFVISLYARDKSKIVLRQEVFGRLINDFDFSMILTFNNEEDEKLLKATVHSSKFSIRD